MTGSGRIDGPVALLDQRGCADLVQALDRLERAERQALAPNLRNLRNLALSVARPICGTPEPLEATDPSSSLHDPITTSEAADILGCTREYAGRLARRGDLGPSEIRDGARYVSRLDVTAHQTNQDEDTPR